MSQPERTKPYRLRELAEATGLPYITVWRAVDSGEIDSVKLGKVILIPAREAQRFIYGAQK